MNQFSSETLQKIRLSCHEVEATIVLENVMKVYTFLRRIRYKKLTQLCVKWFQNRNRNDLKSDQFETKLTRQPLY